MTLATWGLVVLTFAAVVITYKGYEDSVEMNRRTTAAQAHAFAVSILQDYMRLAVEHPELASKYEKHPTTDRRLWFASHAYSSAEAIYNLTRGEAPWDSTVAGMIDTHALLVTSGAYYCHDYSPGFDSFVHHVLQTRYHCTP